MATSTRTDLEERYRRAIVDALVAAKQVKDVRPSRENSLSITNLEQAWHWAKHDQEKKEGRVNASLS